MDRVLIDNIVKKVITEMNTESLSNNKEKITAGLGVFDSIDTAIEEAHTAQKNYTDYSLEQRREIISLLRK